MGLDSDGQKRVLVVDDEHVLRVVLSEALQREGFVPVVAADADEAVARLDEVTCGVAIVDQNLPSKRGGLDVVRYAHRKQPHLKSILFTGYPSIESAIGAFRAGAFDYVAKPADNPLLMAQVHRAWKAYEDSAQRDELFRKYESLFEIVPGIVWFMTEAGVIKRINNEGAELLGYAPKELLGKPYSILLASGEAESAHWAFKERRTGRRATRGQLVSLRTKPGDARIFEVNATGAWDRATDDPDKRLWGTLGVGWDVTEHAALEEQLEQARRMEAIGRLAGGVAHDFNNILAVVMHNAEHLLESLTEGHPLREDAESLEEVARRGIALTRQLLTVSRRGPVEPESIGLRTILSRFQPLLERLIPENIDLSVHCPEDLPLVRADAAQLEQLLVNLVVNARDAMPVGGRLSITGEVVEIGPEFAHTHGRMEPGKFVMLAVSDTGLGIAPDVQEHMFEPFFTTKEGDLGAGLGLATVYGIVRQAEGHVSVYSEIGVGTSMKVYLPARTDAVESTDATAETLLDASGRNELTLVAEDDGLVRRHLCRALRRAGYDVLEAADGARAFEIGKEHEVELLVTDVIMPNMNGPDLARQLRERYPNMRIIYMSGYVGNVLDSQNLLQDGAVFMQKPFTPREMALAARRILDEPMDPTD